tara:strand:- start:1556 stop:2050 length:495 start_codon:yes stop_codon:yes gene_type:complete
MKMLILHSSFPKIFFLFIALVLISKISLCNENKQILFSNELIGKQIDTKTFKLQNGMKYTSFRVDGGFKTSINKYGTYECSVNIINNQNDKLVKSDYICEFKDQDKLRFWSIGKRLEGSEQDIAAGKYQIIDGEGFWKKYVGVQCLYGIEYVDKFYFSSQNCKN